MLRLYVEAPFAAYRVFSAGRYRPSAPFMTPSAAYGLVLNVAVIESRLDNGGPATVTRQDLPRVRLALGVVGDMPGRESLYQQLHNYPVGQTGRERARYGQKYNIQPIRRELLSRLRAVIALEGNAWLEDRMRQGLREGARYAPEGQPRYGLPHAGDNNLLLSRLEEDVPPYREARWLERVRREEATYRRGVIQLTVTIDRVSMARTAAALYAAADRANREIPDSAWTTVGSGL